MTYDKLLGIARKWEGERLQTLRGKCFEVFVVNDIPCFRPESTGEGRSDGRRAAERFVERFTEAGDRSVSAYQEVTRNASYFLALIAHDEQN